MMRTFTLLIDDDETRLENALNTIIRLAGPDNYSVVALADSRSDFGTRWQEAARTIESAYIHARANLAKHGVHPDVDVDFDVDPQSFGDIVVIGSADWAGVRALLESGRSVVLPGAKTLDFDPVVVPIWRDAHRGLGAVSWIQDILGSDTHVRAVFVDSKRTPDVSALKDVIEWHGSIESESIVLDSFDAARALYESVAPHFVVAPTPTGPEVPAVLAILRRMQLQSTIVLVPDAPLQNTPRIELTDIVMLSGMWRAGAYSVQPDFSVVATDDVAIDVVIEGRVAGQTTLSRGQFLFDGPDASYAGIAPVSSHPIEDLDQVVRVLKPAGPLTLLPPSAHRNPNDRRQVWTVCFGDAAPQSLKHQRGADAVIDARSVVGSGNGHDVPDGVMSILMDRVARRLRNADYNIELVVGGIDGHGYAVIGDYKEATAEQLDSAVQTATIPAAVGDSLGRKLKEITGAIATTASKVEVEFDNHAARSRLIEGINRARHEILIQAYQLDDDTIGHMLVGALVNAARRGVVVRVLVDALYGHTAGIGPVSTPVAALESETLIDLRWSRPIVDLRGLKARDHRKLVVIDHDKAWITGRNFGSPYFTGFDEVAIRPDTPSHQIPWLDTGAVVTGAVVAHARELFASHWIESGGDPLDQQTMIEPDAIIKSWWITHESMADANTLDAYRILFDSARERIFIANTFPLQFELVHALLGLVKRGVDVRFLVGNVRPLLQDRSAFRGEQYRDIASAVIHGRLDILAKAGADVRELVIERYPGWSPDIARIYPHMHVKSVVVDGRYATVGSANLDITSAYWESELMMIVDDVGTASEIEEHLMTHFVRSRRFEPGDPVWEEAAARRSGISRHWPSTLQ